MASVTGCMHGGGFIAASPSLRTRPWLAGRTERSLRAAGLPATAIGTGTGPETDWIPWAVSSGASPDGLTVIRAGAWFPQPRSAAGPEPSATGRPVVAFGLSQRGQDSPWRTLRRRSGGDLSGLAIGLPALDFPPVLALDRRACEALRAGMAWDRLLREARIVHLSTLDVLEDDGLRVCQAVTSLQYGGAERLALDLHRELRRTGTAARLLVLGRPGRSAFPWPEECLDLSEIPAYPDNRAMAVNAATVQFGADVLHAHLLSAAEINALRPGAPPVVLTLHNTCGGWPAGLASLGKNDVALLAACSLGVEEEARRLLPALPVRTAWNGIDLQRFQPTPQRAAAAAAFRSAVCGLKENGLLLLTLANPRPQKRLDRLPAVLAALKRRCPGRPVRLLLAGEPAAFNREAAACVAAVRQAAGEHGVEGEIIFHGPSADPATLLAAADVLISTAAHEGLSLAHLEALAMGVPVVALEAGGTGEVATAAESGAFTRLPQHAGPDELATAVLTAAAKRVSGREAVRRCFSLETMTRRYQRLYRTALMAPARAGKTIWLITNNFSTGGAQSSARRLLAWWHGQSGLPVRAAVLQEEPAEPTPGRAALEEAGIPVLVLPAIGPREAAETLEPLWPELAADPPRAVLLWNAVTSCKRMIADALPHTPVFDISPGGMFFEALHPSFSRLRPDLPALMPAAYGAQLAGAVVKYARERTQAETALGCPVSVIPN
ncbi:MAG: glycosyltransferase, partial [Verrucomicrobiaceae bacterium]